MGVLKLKDILKVTFVIIGTTIGAGFASGQEIALFFNTYGVKGIFGIIISSILTGVIINQVFNIMNKNSITNYGEFLNKITSLKKEKSISNINSKTKNSTSKINQILKIIVQLFLLISFYIMVAGFCAYFNQEWNIPIWMSSVIIDFLCYLTFHKNIQGVISINTFLIPALIVFVFFLYIKNIPFINTYFSHEVNTQMCNGFPMQWLISSILYTSYNSILLIPILIPLKSLMNNKEKIKKTSLLCSLILAILGICIFCLLLRGGEYYLQLELPMLQIVKEFGKIYPLIYGIVIIAAIFTSAISAGYGFLSDYINNTKTYNKFVLILCSSSILIAPIGFANLVNIWYPFFGVLGILQIFLIRRFCNCLK